MVRQRNGRLRQISSKLWSQHSGERFILSRGAPSPVEIPIHVPGETGIRSHGFSLKTRLLPVSRFPQLKPRLGQSRAVFDSDLAGPQLLLRSPRRGDRFQPLGMKGHKKVSDYLIDVKMATHSAGRSRAADQGGGDPLGSRDARQPLLPGWRNHAGNSAGGAEAEPLLNGLTEDHRDDRQQRREKQPNLPDPR